MSLLGRAQSVRRNVVADFLAENEKLHLLQSFRIVTMCTRLT
jgi:hypothetical protein